MCIRSSSPSPEAIARWLKSPTAPILNHIISYYIILYIYIYYLTCSIIIYAYLILYYTTLYHIISYHIISCHTFYLQHRQHVLQPLAACQDVALAEVPHRLRPAGPASTIYIYNHIIIYAYNRFQDILKSPTAFDPQGPLQLYIYIYNII